MNSTEKTKDKPVGKKEKLSRIQMVEPENSEFKRKEAEKRLRGKVKDMQKLSAEEAQRQVEQVTRDAQKYAESIVATVREPLLVLDADLRVRTVNRSFYRTFQVTPEETENRLLYDIGDHQWNIPKLRELLEKILPKNTTIDDFEVEYDFPTIGRRIMLLNARRIYREGNKTQTILLSIEDITERKRAEEAIRQASNYNRSLIEASLDPLVTISPEGKITDVNKATELVTGVQREQLIGTDFSDYFTEPEKSREGYKQVLKKDLVRDYPLAIRHTSGKVTEVLYNASLYRDQAGNLIGVFAAARDITTVRKQMEEKLRQLALVVESSDDAIVSKTLDGIILNWNTGAERIYGYSAEEVKGRSISILYPPNSPGEMSKVLDKIRQGEHVDHYQTERLTKDGRLITISLSVSPIKNPNGTLIGASSIARDITREKLAESRIKALHEDLKRRTEELEAINKELETFSYSVSHDLRAPLRGINGFSEALLEEYADKLDTQGKDFLQRVCAASRHMGELIEGMLNLSRVTRTPLRQQAMDLSAMARSIANELCQRQPERQVEFVIAEGVMGNGDPRLLEIVLENLLSNAWKFTEKHLRARIEFGVTQKEGESVYFVRDDGAGFDMAYVDKLFGAFQRLYTKDEFEGTGIGLTTVQRIIHSHRGRVWAEGGVEKGATFYFTLPKVNATVIEETLNKGRINEEEICLIGGGQQ